MARKGQENLIPANKRSKGEARENGRKGGIASGKARRAKRDIKAYLDILLDMDLQTKDGKLMQGSERIATALFTKAANGDLTAIQKVLDLKYPKEQKIDLTSSDGSMSPLDVRIKVVDPKQTDE
jgi:hypothetical protein